MILKAVRVVAKKSIRPVGKVLWKHFGGLVKEEVKENLAEAIELVGNKAGVSDSNLAMLLREIADEIDNR